MPQGDGGGLPVDDPTLAFICRLCTKMAESREHGAENCGREDCGGPSTGRAFPLYSGPLALVVSDYCYRCGEWSFKVIAIDGKGKLGVCKSCLNNIFGRSENKSEEGS